ncbi:MAG TPA: LOG family protein [Acetobacteraceae bacterium]|nr:LOG family protein [Acetobacteraceae bacterium]
MPGNAPSAPPPDRVPNPPNPRQRRQPLPWHQPKPSAEDPAAPEAVRAIIDSPTYREADRDVDFLDRNDTRGVRLQLDYLKAELLLQGRGVAHTVVVFGSTRIPQPDTARRALESCQAAAARAPGDAVVQQRLAVARRAADNSRYYDVARRFGQLVGAAGEQALGGRIMVMTGGGPGIMEAANRGAHDLGKHSIGLNITLPDEQYPNPYVTPELCFSFHYFSMRKLHFLLRARALVVFPGGFGTMDELFELLTLVQTRKISPLPIILVGETFWRQAFNPDFLVNEGVIDPEDRELFWYAETAEQIWDDILLWYEAAGRPLLAPGQTAATGKARQ